MFAVTALLTAIGAASPAACAIIGPIALGFAGRYGISPLMMGMFVVHGAQAGGFSPISIYGTITNSVMERRRPALQRDHGLPGQPGRQPDPGRGPLRRPRRPRADVPAARPRRPRHPGRATCTAAARADPAARHRHDHRDRHHDQPALGVRRDQVLTLLAFVARRRRSRSPSTRTSASSRSPPPSSSRCSRPNAAQGRRQADRLADRAAGRRRQHLRHDPHHRRAPGVRRQLGRRPGRGRDRRADPLLRRRRGLGVRLVDRAAAGDHPDRDPADRRRRHQRRRCSWPRSRSPRRSSTSARSRPTAR